MKMYQIEEVKPFMAQLLLQEIFDKFCVSVAEIRTIVPITIKGTMSHDWLSPEDAEKYKDRNYSLQEYLDREDEYTIKIFVDEKLALIKTVIDVNDWIIQINDIEL